MSTHLVGNLCFLQLLTTHSIWHKEGCTYPLSKHCLTYARCSLHTAAALVQERSCIYDRLMEVENLARTAKRGIHSAKEPPANRINDMSQPGHAARLVQQCT